MYSSTLCTIPWCILCILGHSVQSLGISDVFKYTLYTVQYLGVSGGVYTDPRLLLWASALDYDCQRRKLDCLSVLSKIQVSNYVKILLVYKIMRSAPYCCLNCICETFSFYLCNFTHLRNQEESIIITDVPRLIKYLGVDTNISG